MSVSCLNVYNFLLWGKVVFVIDVRWAQIVKKYLFSLWVPSPYIHSICPLCINTFLVAYREKTKMMILEYQSETFILV